jgi:hypothetical protein
LIVVADLHLGWLAREATQVSLGTSQNASGEKLLDNKVESSVQVIIDVIKILDSGSTESSACLSIGFGLNSGLEVFVGTHVKAGMEVCQWDSTHTGLHDRTASFLGGTVESLTDLDDIRLPTENLLNRFVSTEDLNHVMVLGRIGIGLLAGYGIPWEQVCYLFRRQQVGSRKQS